ncbi:MAG: peroxidase family protein [Caulobacteraceae bacterium]
MGGLWRPDENKSKLAAAQRRSAEGFTAMLAMLIRLLESWPPVLAVVNRWLIARLASSTPPRPHRFSLWSPSDASAPAAERFPASSSNQKAKPAPAWVSDYTSWPGLFDRGFTGRHLPPRLEDDGRRLPPAAEVVALFKRGQAMIPSPRSSTLFCFFAQWFTDSFLRTDPTDPRRTTSNHEIDLCQIYGLDEPSTWALRAGIDGRLKSRLVGGQEFPCLLFKDGKLDPQFFDPDPVDQTGLTFLGGGRDQAWMAAIEASLPGAMSDPSRRDWFYASGLDRGGSTLLYSAFNTIFLREHNRLAGEIGSAHPNWDDDRLFETARMINIRQMLTIVINDYIRHLAGLFPFALDRTFAEKTRWYRVNRISIEFDLLYRWHSLVPGSIELDGASVPAAQYRYNNQLFELVGVEKIISEASSQPAGRIGLFNTPDFLLAAEQRGLQWARDFRVESFNAYRERFGLKRYGSIEEMADSDLIAEHLRVLYSGDVDAVEFTVGLFAEKRAAPDVMGETLRTIVAYDAFTHILTNPVLASQVHCEDAFSDVGWTTIKNGATLAQLIERNCDRNKTVTVSLSV